jgi:hypothetical protein
VLTTHPDLLKTSLTVLALVAAPATALAAVLYLWQRLTTRRVMGNLSRGTNSAG